MKTTVDIADPLLREARKLAAQEGVTLRTIIERGLSRIIREARKPAAFKLRRGAFKGRGLQAEFHDASWEKLRDAAYESRGG